MAAKLGRIFSGIQPSAGVPHLGNYIGAIKPWVKYQDTASVKPILSVVDLHALTNPHLSPENLRENTLQMTASLLACGLDPKKCIIFQQSAVPHHSELAWILICCSTLDRVQRLHAWREKLKTLGKNKGAPLGVLMYPLLMAADILLYRANSVPVGEDQTQHIELTRELALYFNSRYKCSVMTIPEKIINEESNRIKSLRDPTSKMSKSEENEASFVTILDSPETIQAKFKKAVTDSNPVLTFDPETRPGKANLINIYASMQDLPVSEAMKDVQNFNTVQLKTRTSEIVIEKFEKIRLRHEELMQNRDYLNQVLTDGKLAAFEIADTTLKDIKIAVGVL